MAITRIMWNSILGDWANPLEHLISTEYMSKLLKFLNKEYRERIIYPEKTSVFKVFLECKFKDVEVVILGQDPYFDGNATGIAFSNSNETYPWSPSLEKIQKCIEKEFYDNLHFGFDPTLKDWCKQGVLLLNSALTVVEKEPGSHRKYWSKFIKHVLQTIYKHKPDTIFCLWGSVAKSFKQFIPDAKYILECSHPASAAYNKVDWECDNFKKVNRILLNTKRDIILW